VVTTEMYRQVRAALARAQELFGDGVPLAPPVFAAPADLEDEVGRGAF
jgi:hypothetical protein